MPPRRLRTRRRQPLPAPVDDGDQRLVPRGGGRQEFEQALEGHLADHDALFAGHRHADGIFAGQHREVTVAPDGDGLPAGLVQRGVGLMEQRIEGEINATQDWRGLARCRRQADAAHPTGMVEQEGDLEQASVADGGLKVILEFAPVALARHRGQRHQLRFQTRRVMVEQAGHAGGTLGDLAPLQSLDLRQAIEHEHRAHPEQGQQHRRHQQQRHPGAQTQQPRERLHGKRSSSATKRPSCTRATLTWRVASPCASNDQVCCTPSKAGMDRRVALSEAPGARFA